MSTGIEMRFGGFSIIVGNIISAAADEPAICKVAITRVNFEVIISALLTVVPHVGAARIATPRDRHPGQAVPCIRLVPVAVVPRRAELACRLTFRPGVINEGLC